MDSVGGVESVEGVERGGERPERVRDGECSRGDRG